MNNTTKQINLTPYKQRISIISANINKLSIKNDAEIKYAADILLQIKNFKSKIEEEKTKYVTPAKAIIAQAKKNFDPFLIKCNEAEKIIKDKMVKFSFQKEQANLKKLNALAEKISSGKIDLEQASEKVKNLEKQKSYSGDIGSVQFRVNKIAIITDESKLPRKYLMPNSVLIRTDILAGVKIPGAEMKIEKIVASGRN